MVTQAKALLLQPGMLKKLICSKSAVPVRSACCSLVALLSRRYAQHPVVAASCKILTRVCPANV